MARKIFVLFILLFGGLSVVSSQNGITVKLLKPEASAGNGVAAPQFEGGEERLYKYLTDNVRYPALLIRIEMEGDVNVKFTVKEDGTVDDIEILSGFDPLADDQIVAAIKKMPRWIPGTIDSGKEVVALPVEMTISFTLNDELRGRLAEIEKEEEIRKSTETQKGNVSVIDQVLADSIPNAKSDTLQNRLAEFPGGQKALEEYLKTNLKYPKRAIQMNIEGRVVFNLSVSSDGEITKIELFKGLYSECNEEAFYLIKRMPRWTPGLKDGKPAAMQVMLPIAFVLP